MRILLPLVLLAAPLGAQASTCPEQHWPAAHWAEATPAIRVGWSTEGLEAARAHAESIGSAAVMVVHCGTVVAAWGDTASRTIIQSARKSILSMLFGIVLAPEGLDLDRTVAQLGITDNTPLTPEEEGATLRHLLLSSSGIYLPAAASGWRMPDRGSHPPGTFWYYNNWDFNVLGTVFQDATGGEDLYVTMTERLAVPVGMEDWRIIDGVWQREQVSAHPAYHMAMTARDMARVGLLMSRHGAWDGTQLVDPDWVDESTSGLMTTNPPYPPGEYGYMWWVHPDRGTYSARGGGGHLIEVDPANDLVIVHRVPMPGGGGIRWGAVDQLVALVRAAMPGA